MLLFVLLAVVLVGEADGKKRKRKRKQRQNQAGVSRCLIAVPNHRSWCTSSPLRARCLKRRTSQDKDYREAYGVCEAEQNKCGQIKPETAKPPCVLRCMSAKCYQQIYGQDELEEGELDYTRRREYKTCFRKELNERKAVEKESDQAKDGKG